MQDQAFLLAGQLHQSQGRLPSSARWCAARRWVLNEKHVVVGVGLDEAADLLGGSGRSAAELTRFVDALRTALT